MRGGFKPVISDEIAQRVKERKRMDREEFISLLKYVQHTIGPDVVTFGDETQEQMERISKKRSSNKKKKKREIGWAIDQLMSLADYYPNLKKEFSKELKDLK
jgi:hypothetical protein